MGCVSSKRVRPPSPASAVRFDSTLSKRDGFGELGEIREENVKESEEESVGSRKLKKSKSIKKGSFEKRGVFGLRFGKYTEAEQIAAGWPPWLSAVAGDAVDGWLPLRAELFEKLEKIGQGTYSNVYRARDVETGRIVALKKVRFDTFQPESVKFMAREILILRRLDHPNIMKLEGLITSRLSCSIYLVFEYMEHDLSGLLSCPDINFSDAQIKCYMRQLLAGLEHCHSRGVMHRDIKTSNILVNNDGILKITDFGLASYNSGRHQQALTSRVVTLWYRPPELLLGSTTYSVSVDLWSAGCVFAELFIGEPILKGRTEVEQLHKIFKLCGSPPDDYWNMSKLPLATMFKPHHPYKSSLRERCKEFPKSAVILLETFLSVEPDKRGTATSALNSEYFTTKPYACDPSSLPKYPPNKEIDAKIREKALRRKPGVRSQVSGTSRNKRRARKALQEPSSLSYAGMEATTQFTHRNNGGNATVPKIKGGTKSLDSMKLSSDTLSEASQVTEVSQADSIRSAPVVSASSGFAWAKKHKANALLTGLHSRASLRNQNLSPLDPTSILHARDTSDSRDQEIGEFSSKLHDDLGGYISYEVGKCATRRQQNRPHRPDSFDTSDLHLPQEFLVDNVDTRERVEFSGPLLTPPHILDEVQENHIQQAVCRSRGL